MYISPLTPSGQRSRASWAPQTQKSATLSPQPGGKTSKFIRTGGGIGGDLLSSTDRYCAEQSILRGTIDTARNNAFQRKRTDNIRLYFGLFVKGALSSKVWSKTPFPTTRITGHSENNSEMQQLRFILRNCPLTCGHIQHMYSWWWVGLSPETCRVKAFAKNKKHLLHLVGIFFTLKRVYFIIFVRNILLTTQFRTNC